MIIGHRIDKVNAETGKAEGRIEIKCNANLNKVDRDDLFVAGEKKPGLNFGFNFTADYASAGKIAIDGTLFYAAEKKVMDEIEKQWKKDRKIDEEKMIPIINRAMAIGYTEAIFLADRLKLPSPLKMPRVAPQEKQN